MRGGARATSGFAPDPNALRRERDAGDWVSLPPEGRKGAAPEWPLETCSARERKLWDREWARPQAVMWERNQQELEVGLYVRSIVAAEQHDAPTQARVLVKQQMEGLGISVPGLARNRWRIEAAQPESAPRQTPAGRSAKDRFRVVTGGGGT